MTNIPILFNLMKENNVTQKQLAAAVGTSQGNVADWKSGRSTPSLDKLVLIAHYFEVSTDYLLGVSDEKNAPGVTTEGALLDRLNQLSDLELDELEHFLDYLLYKRSRSSHS